MQTFVQSIIVLFCTLIFAVSGADDSAKGGIGWPSVPYSRVVGYSFNNGDNKTEWFSLLSNGKLREDKLAQSKTKEVKMDAAQAERLLHASFDSQVRERGAACYEPHHIFVFYDRDSKPVGAIEICFQCRALKSWPYKDTDLHHDYAALARLSWELGLGLGSPKVDLDYFLKQQKEHFSDQHK